MRTSAGWAMVAVGGVLAACHSAPLGEGSTGESQEAIQGGAVDTADTFAVGIVDQAASILCSGALIAPNLVLTARHCVSEVPNETVHCASDTFGKLRDASTLWVTTDVRVMTAQASSYRGRKLFVPSDSALCGNDIALIELEVALPDTASLATPALEHPLTDAAHYDRSVAAIGYGATSPAGREGGTRRIREGIAIACIPGDAKIPCPNSDSLRPSEFATADGTCQGDSGSSAYEQKGYDSGAALTFGVLSRGGQDRDADVCVGAIYTRVDSFRDLIVNAALEAARDGAYPPPSWTKAPRFDGADAGDLPDGDAELASQDSKGSAAAEEKGCTAAPTGASPPGGMTWLAGLVAALAIAGRRRSCRRRP